MSDTSHRNLNRLAAGFVFIVSLGVYIKTLAPTVPFWDCGEFISCSYILGVPHPPGSPLFVLLGRIFTLLPIASEIAWRVNLMSAITSAFAVMLTYLTTVRLLLLWRRTSDTAVERMDMLAARLSLRGRAAIYVGSVVAALSLAFSDTFWFNAVEAEVYGFAMFFMMLAVWLTLYWMERRDDPESDKILLFIAYLFGLAGGVHLQVILTLPTILMILYFVLPKPFSNPYFWWGILIFLLGATSHLHDFVPFIAIPLALFALYFATQSPRNTGALRFAFPLLAVVLLFTIGYYTYFSLMIRSGMNPIIDENDPENWANFVQFLQRKQYGEESQLSILFDRKAPFWDYQIWNMCLKYLLSQFPLGFDDLSRLVNFGFRMATEPTSMVVPVSIIPILLGLYGVYLHAKRDIKQFLPLLVLFIISGLGLAIYLNMPDPQPRERDYVFVGAFAPYAIWIGMAIFEIIDLIGRRVTSLAPVALLSGLFLLMPVFILKTNFTSHDRTGNYIPYDYAYNILQTSDRDAVLFTNGDNDTFPLWFLQEVEGIRKDVKVVNLSLLNTPWYIKQLRDFPPKIKIRYSDEYIDNALCASTADAAIESGRVDRDPDPTTGALQWKTKRVEAAGISWELPAVEGYSLLRVQDVMVFQIVNWNNWERPIYFAVTVADENKIGLQDYLSMEGMGFRLTKTRGVGLNAERSYKNLWDIYQYRGVKDPRVYKDDNTRKLLTNYRAAYLQLAETYRTQGKNDQAYAAIKRCDDLIGMSWREYYWAANLCARMSKKPEGIGFVEKAIATSDSSNPDETLAITKILLDLDGIDRAISIYRKLINQRDKLIFQHPSIDNAYYDLSSALERKKDYKTAIETLQQLKQKRPDDKEVDKAITQLREKMTTGSR
jgi:tetratricopeptide (TPR) repeat protein